MVRLAVTLRRMLKWNVERARALAAVVLVLLDWYVAPAFSNFSTRDEVESLTTYFHKIFNRTRT